MGKPFIFGIALFGDTTGNTSYFEETAETLAARRDLYLEAVFL
jgi:hypothetical protein